MKTLSLSEVKMKLSQFVEEVSDTDNPISITRNGRSVAILLSQELFDGWVETLNIMHDPGYYDSVLDNVHQLNRGEGISLTADELFKDRTNPKRTRQQPVRIKVLPKVKNEITSLHPDIQAKVYKYLRKIASEEEAGKMLKHRLDGLAVFQVGQYRVVYRLRMHAIELVNIDTRESSYYKPETPRKQFG